MSKNIRINKEGLSFCGRNLARSRRQMTLGSLEVRSLTIVVSHAVVELFRVAFARETFSRICSADLVQTNVVGFSLWWRM